MRDRIARGLGWNEPCEAVLVVHPLRAAHLLMTHPLMIAAAAFSTLRIAGSSHCHGLRPCSAKLSDSPPPAQRDENDARRGYDAVTLVAFWIESTCLRSASRSFISSPLCSCSLAHSSELRFPSHGIIAIIESEMNSIPHRPAGATLSRRPLSKLSARC